MSRRSRRNRTQQPTSAMSNAGVHNEIRQEAQHMVQNGLGEALLGFSPNSLGAQLSKVDTLFQNNRWYLVSNMRQLLSEIYVEHGLVQTVVDVPVDDGLRGGVDIKTKQLDEDEIEKLRVTMEREDDLGIMGQGLKWNRLFGGAGVIIMTGQDPTTPLDLDAIQEGDEVAFRAVDMWELFWDKQSTESYDVTMQEEKFEHFNYYGVKLHKSRVMKMKGLTAPSFIRPRLRGWGFSIMEATVRSINQYLKANNLTFEVLDEFKVDIFKIKNLANTLLLKDGDARVRQRVALANQQKNYQNAITMDAEDDYIAKELAFTGISETMIGIRMAVASDLRMPLTKVFGISAAGFSSGEDDIENYNSMIESQVRSKCKYDILKMIEIRCQQLFGFIPDDLSITFKPLRILSAEQEENVKTQKFQRLHQAMASGYITIEEFKEACNKDDLLPIQVDTSIDVLDVGADDESNPRKARDVSGGAKKLSAPKSTIAAKEADTARNSISPGPGHSHIARICVVGIICGDEILTGKRKDNGLWTFPGGHADHGEGDTDAAIRETREESGIVLGYSDLQPLPIEKVKSHRVEGKEFFVVPFVAELPNKERARTVLDPDQEISEWRWVKLDKATPELQPESRHAKKDSVLEHLFKVRKS